MDKRNFMAAAARGGVALASSGPVGAAGLADLMSKPLPDRFTLCPWGLYHIDVQPA